MTDPIIQSITDAGLLTAKAHRAGYEAGYVAGKALLNQARAEIANSCAILRGDYDEAKSDALQIIDAIIAATDGRGP